jgi:NitT/TauT family transport system substrate-binding protein
MRLLRRCLFAALALVSSPDLARAADMAIMVGGIEKQIYLPAILAQRLGYFRDAGVDVELLSEPAGVEAADEMLAGAVQGVVGFYDHTIELQSLGKFTESVVQFGIAPGEVELVSNLHPEISSIADLKGKRIGITGLGSSTDFLTEFLLQKNGIKLSDVTPVPVGAGDTLIAALAHDQVQAAMTTEPTVSRLLSTGAARILVDTRTRAGSASAFGGEYPASCLYMESSWVQSHKDLVQKLVTAFVRALRFIADNDADTIASVVPDDFFVGNRTLYVDALKSGKEMFSEDGRMPADGPDTVLSVLRQIHGGLRGKPIDLIRTYTNTFVDQAAVE